ncbi:MAG: hypothetical protein AABZ33_13715 [Chloroflexota bacterium]
MPFDFLKRKQPGAPPPGSVAAGASHGDTRPIRFDGLTDEWRLLGTMHVTGRMSDAINRREPIEISDVRWGPIDGSAPPEPAPGLRSVDPYDLILIMAGEGTLPLLSEDQRAAQRVHKVTYDLALEVPPFRVIGTVQLHPGSEPERLLDRATEMFVPVLDATCSIAGRSITEEPVDAILVNRFYLRGIEQIDLRTGERHQKLPGAPLGGVSWQDRSR